MQAPPLSRRAPRGPRAPRVPSAPRAPHRSPSGAVGQEDLLDGRIQRAARWSGSIAGSLWAAVLWGSLLGAGRVPWLEAMWWSLVSGLVVGRTAFAVARRILSWLLEVRTLEVGPMDPPAFRAALKRRMAAYGYRCRSPNLHTDVFEAATARLRPPLRVAWSGPGAVLEGPRFALRSAARLAVG